MTFQTLSYAIASLAYLAGWSWTLRGRDLPARSRWLPAALLVNALWAASLVPASHGPQWAMLPAVELVRYGCWLVAMPALLGPGGGAWLRRLNLVLWSVAALATIVSPVLSVLLLAFAGLVNIEQLLRNAQPEQRRGVKFCVIGLGVMFVFDLFFYSEYALLRSANLHVWNLRGLLNSVALPFLLLGMARLERSASRIFISRQVVFYSTAFVAVGIYLIGMALVGQYLRAQSELPGEWLRALLLLGSVLVLAVLLSSESPWRRLKVFLAKHFYSNKYDYRLEWLRFVATLGDQRATDAAVTSIHAIAQIFEAPGGALFMRDDDTRTYTSVATWSIEESGARELPALPAGHDMIRFMEQKEWVIDLDEYQRSPAVYQSIRLPEFLMQDGAGWRIISPLFERERLLAFLVLKRPPEPFTMTFEDRDLLRMVGRHVATLLAQQAADRRLSESRQFDAFNRFAAFVMHDLKNSVAQLQLLAANAARHRGNPEFIDDAFITIENTASRITRLISQLQSRDEHAGTRVVDAAQVIALALERCAVRQPAPLLQGAIAECHVTADPERLTAVLEHVLRNAQDAAGPAGQVQLHAGDDGEFITITIIDTGPGMDQEFVRERLFRPFDSTKGSKGMGIGAYQTREYVREIGGSVEVQSRPGAGTRFVIRLPLCQKSENTY